jgi:hypothetical protein
VKFAASGCVVDLILAGSRRTARPKSPPVRRSAGRPPVDVRSMSPRLSDRMSA